MLLHLLKLGLLLADHLQEPIHLSFLLLLQFLMQFPQTRRPLVMCHGRRPAKAMRACSAK